MPKRAVSFADDIETRTFKRDRLDIEQLEKDENFDMPMEDDEPKHKKEEDDEELNDKKKHHTLESDEEEEEDHKRMDMKRVEGQEDTTMDFDGTIKITAFNMKEDMEEGHFDDAGNFIFDKKEKDVQDAWLDGIDWSTVKKRAGDQWEGEDGQKPEEDENAPITMSDLRKKEIFGQLVEMLKPNQTVAKALTELKKKKGLSAAEERKLRWAAKKAGKLLEETDGQKETAKLSGLADELISAGFMDAYEWHKEKIAHMLQKMNTVAVDDLDMFSDEPVGAASSTGPSTSENDLDDEVKWEYKENDEPSTAVQGPFSSSEMADRQSKGELASKGVARRLNTPGSFNPVSRIDFDLYC